MYHNLPYPQVFEHETKNKEGQSTANGTFCVSTGQFTGRSPKDKYFVKQVLCLSYAVYCTGCTKRFLCTTFKEAWPRLVYFRLSRSTHVVQPALAVFFISVPQFPSFGDIVFESPRENRVDVLMIHEHQSVEQDL